MDVCFLREERERERGERERERERERESSTFVLTPNGFIMIESSLFVPERMTDVSE